MKKWYGIFLVLILAGLVYAQENALRDMNEVPSMLVDYEGETKRLKGYSGDGLLIKEVMLLETVTAILLYETDPNEIEEDITVNGLTNQIHFIVPDLTASHTAELLIHDANDNIIYASGEKAEDTDYVINVERPLVGTTTIRVETSDDQTADETFKVYLYHR